MVRYLFASLFTLGLLCSLSFGFFILVLLMLDAVSPSLALGLTITLSIFFWLVGPFFTDFINRWAYGLKFQTPEELKKAHPEIFALIDEICKKHQFKMPKVGIIADKNPTAFTYGSGRYNARLVLTEGIFHFLNKEEQKAVVAHEMGHIVNRDFIVMMVASTAVQVLYQIYAILIRAKGKKAQNLKIVALVAYVCYWLSTYLLLYLSRTREYLADRFSTDWTEPKHLAEALVKIAYGIVAAEDDEHSKDLLRSTRHLGIVDVKNVKNVGMVSYITHENPDHVSEVMVFDHVNPWAKIIELNSTHPLTGNRLDHLSDISKEKHQKFPYDVDAAIARLNVEKGRLYSQFFKDLVLSSSPVILALLVLPFAPEWALLAFGMGLFIRIFYKYPQSSKAEETNILDEMRNPYASPVRGKAIAIQGKAIGKGVPGYIFSEDMMYQDKTGMALLDYRSMWGFVGNLLFALTKVKSYFGLDSQAKGWFFRSMGSFIVLDSLKTKDHTLESYPRLWGFIIAGAAVIGGIALGVSTFVLYY